MTKLMIKDLAVAADLDRAAMSAVRGGTSKGYGYCAPSFCLPQVSVKGYAPQAAPELNFNASQMIGQSQNVMNNNGNNVAFASGIHSTVNPTQTANNSISF
ncbi:MAG TPA: hypothetical protein VEC01_12605 [Noviherbaspirillum sp.]|uniref:hypothetical protein n=1 Tax=Noviherbaspirillum sp. TaxID=1926288 RepID=UPI002D6D9B87|nr:hypothetical protein [Noviherbaspirillum sp.]HYD96160.1 hypothetical protein [Noviherbaspirillum sp.]